MSNKEFLKKDSTFGLFLALPALLGIGGVIIFPLLYSFFMSFYKIDILHNKSTWAGLSNYSELLFDDPIWWISLKNTFLFVAAAVMGEFIFGLGLALLVNGLPQKARPVFQTLFLLPMTVALVIAAMIWRWLLVDQYGIINYFLGVLGLSEPQWFGSPILAMLVLIIVDWWVATPFAMICLFAGLQNLPPEIIDAAMIDGASAWHRLRQIILPLLKPVILFIILIRTMDAFRIFDTVYILTGGGPGSSTEVITSYGYDLAFANLKFGRTAALSVITFLIIMVISIFYLKIFVVEEH